MLNLIYNNDISFLIFGIYLDFLIIEKSVFLIQCLVNPFFVQILCLKIFHAILHAITLSITIYLSIALLLLLVILCAAVQIIFNICFHNYELYFYTQIH